MSFFYRYVRYVNWGIFDKRSPKKCQKWQKWPKNPFFDRFLAFFDPFLDPLIFTETSTLGRKMAPKSDTKMVKKRHFLMIFWSDFGKFWVPERLPEGFRHKFRLCLGGSGAPEPGAFQKGSFLGSKKVIFGHFWPFLPFGKVALRRPRGKPERPRKKNQGKGAVS